MTKLHKLKRLFPFILIFTAQHAWSECACTFKPLKNILEKHRDTQFRDMVYVRATVIRYNRYILPTRYVGLDIKIHGYWSPQTIDFKTDTLTILSGNQDCALRYPVNKEFLLMLKPANGIFIDYPCSGSALFSDYEKEIQLLGPLKTIITQTGTTGVTDPIKTKPKRTEKERRKQLVIWLVASLSLNLVGILLMVILKREKA